MQLYLCSPHVTSWHAQEQPYTCLFSYQLLIYHFIICKVGISSFLPLSFNILSLTIWSKTQVSLQRFRPPPKTSELPLPAPAHNVDVVVAYSPDTSIPHRSAKDHPTRIPADSLSIFSLQFVLICPGVTEKPFFSELLNKALQVYNSLQGPNAS